MVAQIQPRLPPQAEMLLVPESPDAQFAAIEERLNGVSADVIVIDGLDRVALLPVAFAHLKPGGCVLFDNADWGGLLEAVAPYRAQRIDYYGASPGVPLQHCTAMFFVGDCFLLTGDRPFTPMNVVPAEQGRVAVLAGDGRSL